MLCFCCRKWLKQRRCCQNKRTKPKRSCLNRLLRLPNKPRNMKGLLIRLALLFLLCFIHFMIGFWLKHESFVFWIRINIGWSCYIYNKKKKQLFCCYMSMLATKVMDLICLLFCRWLIFLVFSGSGVFASFWERVSNNILFNWWNL